MHFRSLQRVAAATALFVSFTLLCRVSAAEPSALAASISPSRHVLDVNRGDRIATARLRIAPNELRELLYRLLDEDGFRVVRYTGAIPKEGETLKAKKHLRHVECEIVPDADPQVTTLSFEYSRFGNRPWSERALNMVIAELTKHDAPEIPAPHPVVQPAPEPVAQSDAPKAPIPALNYFDPSYEDKYETSMPIPPLSIQPLATPSSGGTDADKDADTKKSDEPKSIASAQPTGITAEVVTLPGQKNAHAPNPGEEIFRSIQRGDVTTDVGDEKIRMFLDVYWLDASHAPSAAQQKTFAQKLTQALARRQFGSRNAGSIVTLVDQAVRPTEVAPQTRRLLLEQLAGILDEADVEAKDRAMWTDEVESLIAPQ
jgi:hypothetical protein